MTQGAFTDGCQATEATHEISAPPARTEIADGIYLIWSGEAALMEFGREDVAITETNSGVALDAMSVSKAFIRQPSIRTIQQFETAWKAWTHHPGKSGATRYFQRHLAAGDYQRPENIIWTAPSEVHEIPRITFGLPHIKFHNSNWEVQIGGFDLVLQTIAWNDEELIKQTVNTLNDEDYWRSIAALLNPAKWRSALAIEASRKRKQEAIAMRAREDNAANTAFADPALAVSTRKLAKLIREFIQRNPEEERLMRSVIMEHCDLIIPERGPTRVAECLDIHWRHNPTIASQRSLVIKLNEALAPHGYAVILTKKGRIIVSKNNDLIKTHLISILRHRKEHPYVCIH